MALVNLLVDMVVLVNLQQDWVVLINYADGIGAYSVIEVNLQHDLVVLIICSDVSGDPAASNNSICSRNWYGDCEEYLPGFNGSNKIDRSYYRFARFTTITRPCIFTKTTNS